MAWGDHFSQSLSLAISKREQRKYCCTRVVKIKWHNVQKVFYVVPDTRQTMSGSHFNDHYRDHHGLFPSDAWENQRKLWAPCMKNLGGLRLGWCDPLLKRVYLFFFEILSNLYTLHGARIYNPESQELRSCIFYPVSQPGSRRVSFAGR